MRVDLPALGRPTRPTSASSLSSSRRRFSSPSVPGSARRGARLVGVAKFWLPLPPLPPAGHLEALPVAQQLAQHLAGVVVHDHGAHRHLDHEVLARLAGAVAAQAVLAALGGVDRLEAEVVEGVQAFVGDQEDRAAVTAVAARRAAVRDVLLAPERDAPVPTAASADRI